MAYYPIRAAVTCSLIDKTYMSTDDERLMVIAKRHKVTVIQRPPELCSDKALGEDVYRHAYRVIKDTNDGAKIDYIVLLMCNAPMVTAATIAEGITVLRDNPSYDSAVTVSKYNMWSPLRARRINAQGLLDPFVPLDAFGDTKTMNCDRDSQGDVWFADMGVSIIRPRCLEHLEEGLLPQKWMGRKIYPLKQQGGLDVDYEWQVPQVKFWLKEHRSK
jgi:hypothetical protein